MMYCEKRFTGIIFILVIVFFSRPVLSQQIYTDTIPLGGNAWVNEPAVISDSGLINWSDASSMASIYFRTDVPQTFNLALRLQVPEGASDISIVSGNRIFNKHIANKDFDVVDIGKLVVSKPGYIKVDLKGISKAGAVFANISDLILQHDKPDSTLVYVKKGSSFHFGRRGPSVHLRYPPPDELKSDVHWFYNEITVPAGNDKVGSYFMADGFGEGYFGMQVNSNTERRVLFSVWSPFETENPKDIPDSMRIVLSKKGTAVHAQDFGNEGSGGQSFMRFNWQAGKTYAFLLGAQPDSTHHTTTYTAYFKDISANEWYLIAAFKRPQTVTYLTHLYSFLENFIPETGNETRTGFYKNQWIRNGKGEWHELTNAIFTADATAKGGYRKDYAGGADGDYFFLRNDGFFNGFVKPNQSFTRKASGNKPVIDFAHLPQQ
ncbi:DUF3472 domain-containing protein [Ilyomonas limi]|uniref:DUF3472 domain-containing protein n=1 Tax=Ilyomonas limi TaxID=2575867 RepID=A0A4U3KZS3_9BACT|nr:DUF3472 domain-containing protein [Ilyomonas limi]TKK67972.1 DUF3472 domain-containing protein [Ilyomonas limi]